MPQDVKSDLLILINLAFKELEIFINDSAKSNKYSCLLYNNNCV